MTATDQGALLCRECGDRLPPYPGVGRPRRLCAACRPDWFPPLKTNPGSTPSGQRETTCVRCGKKIVSHRRGRPATYCSGCGPKTLAFRSIHSRWRTAEIRVIPDRDMRRLFHRYRHQCAYCLAPASTIDHVVPLSRGGRHAIGNLVPACLSCNASKGKHFLAVWWHRRAGR